MDSCKTQPPADIGSRCEGGDQVQLVHTENVLSRGPTRGSQDRRRAQQAGRLHSDRGPEWVKTWQCGRASGRWGYLTHCWDVVKRIAQCSVE